MAAGVMGRKIGMTQIFDEDGRAIPVTVIQLTPAVVVQKKTEASDGYPAIQVGYDPVREDRLNGPQRGHLARAGVKPHRRLREFRVDDVDAFAEGQELVPSELLAEGQLVDVRGTSKGKGFTGSIKRHGSRRGPATHGSRYHRRPGSMGASADPSRVYPGKKLPGHSGGEQTVVQGLRVVRIDDERNVLMVSGSVPGPKRGWVEVRPSVKTAPSRREG